MGDANGKGKDMVTREEYEILVNLVVEDLAEKGYDFSDVDITVSNRRTTRRLGTTWAHENRIILYHQVPGNTLDLAEDNIRHELAHILAWVRNPMDPVHHGLEWKAACLDLGANPKTINDHDGVVKYLSAANVRAWA